LVINSIANAIRGADAGRTRKRRSNTNTRRLNIKAKATMEKTGLVLINMFCNHNRNLQTYEA